MAETPATLHPWAPAPCSSHTAFAHCELCSDMDSHHFLPVWGKPSWESEKGAFRAPRLPGQMSAHCPAQPGAHCPKNIVLELPDSGVDLGPSSWSWSLRVSVDGRALSCQGHQGPRSTQTATLAPGESGQSASLGAKMGPAEGTQLRSASRKAHPVLRPNPQTGTQAAVMSPPQLGASQGG